MKMARTLARTQSGARFCTRALIKRNENDPSRTADQQNRSEGSTPEALFQVS
jgi:hypothetical protein